MKIVEAVIIFQNLKNNTQDKATSKIYNNFIAILLYLQQRDFTENQKKDIETKLFSLNLKKDLVITKKELNKKITSFEFFLANKFSIISEHHYINKGMAIWLFSCVILFFSFGQYSVIGALLITVLTGVILDLEAKKQDRVIKTINIQQTSFLPSEFSEKEEKHQKDNYKELQYYRRKKLQQFEEKQVQQQEQRIKKHQD